MGEMPTRGDFVSSFIGSTHQWFGLVLRDFFYDGPKAENLIALLPDIEKILSHTRNLNVNEHLIQHIKAAHRVFLRRAADMISQFGAANQKLPPYPDFEALYEDFRAYSDSLKMLHDQILINSHREDTLTGLSGYAAFRKEFAIEMDRFARQGKQFSVALVRIDDFEMIKANLDVETLNDMLRQIAEMILKSIRSFDDAYRFENDEFALLLKQTDISGGMRALERLKRELLEEQTGVKIKGKKKILSMSSCIAAPVPGDEDHVLLEDLRYELERNSGIKGSVLEYYEMTPLQRYLNQKNYESQKSG